MATTSRLTGWRSAMAVVAIAAGAIGSAHAQQGPLKIAAINPYSGPFAIYGDDCARGYSMAIDEYNAKGGVNGRKIEFIRGDATNPQQAIVAVDQLSDREKVDIFVGTYSSAIAAAASDAALRHNKIYWDTAALAAELTERKLPNFIRGGTYGVPFAQTGARAVIELIAPALKKDPKDVTVWIEHEDSIYGKTVGDTQKASLEAKGVKVLGQSAHNARATDLTDSVLRARRAKPDVWLQTGYVPDTNLLLKTAKEQNFKPPVTLLTGTGDTLETAEAAGQEYIEGVLVVAYAWPDVSEKFSPGTAAFMASYRKLYNRDPIAPQTMASYGGMKLLLDTVAAAGSADVEKVRAAAAAMDKPYNTYPGGYGVKFDDKFQNTRAFPTVIQWQSKKQVTVFPLEARPTGVNLVNLPAKQS
jgi:branched-chain amino acid transport system substrate-binding protein